MANIKSQKKRILTNEKARVRNISFKSKVRTSVKKVEAEVKAGNKAQAVILLNEANSLIDKAVTKGIYHSKTAARQKSHLQIAVNAMK